MPACLSLDFLLHLRGKISVVTQIMKITRIGEGTGFLKTTTIFHDELITDNHNNIQDIFYDSEITQVSDHLKSLAIKQSVG